MSVSSNSSLSAFNYQPPNNNNNNGNTTDRTIVFPPNLNSPRTPMAIALGGAGTVAAQSLTPEMQTRHVTTTSPATAIDISTNTPRVHRFQSDTDNMLATPNANDVNFSFNQTPTHA